MLGKQLRAGEVALDRHLYRSRVGRLDHLPVPVDQLARSRPGGDDGKTRRHRFQHDIAERLGIRRQHEDGSVAVYLGEAVLGEVTEELDAGLESVALHQGLQARSLGPVAGDDQPHTARPFGKRATASIK